MSYTKFLAESSLSADQMLILLTDNFPNQFFSKVEDTDRGPAGTFHISASITNSGLEIGLEFQIWRHGIDQRFTNQSKISMADSRMAEKENWVSQVKEKIAKVIAAKI